MGKFQNTKAKFQALICALLLVAGTNAVVTEIAGGTLKSGVANIPDPPRP